MRSVIKAETPKSNVQMKKIEKNKAASWCCEASTTVDIKEMIEAIKKEPSAKKK
jgi:hypothetical protein